MDELADLVAVCSHAVLMCADKESTETQQFANRAVDAMFYGTVGRRTNTRKVKP
jgi:hypothetical protein